MLVQLPAALLVLHVLFPAVVGEAVLPQEGAAQAECSEAEEEDASLLQHSRASHARTALKAQPAHTGVPEQAVAMDRDPAHGVSTGPAWMPELPCRGVEIKPLSPSQTTFMIEKFSTTHLAWWNYPVQQDLGLLDSLKSGLSPIPWGSDVGPEVSWIDMRAVSAKDALPLMYQATNILPADSKVPEKLRGVFWMKGNGAAEELVVLQYGVWNVEEKLLQVTMQPFNWAWAGGKPAGAPFFGTAYSEGVQNGMEGAAFLVGYGAGLSYAFGECEKSCKYCKKGCNPKDGSPKDDLACGYMETSILSNLENASNLGNLYDLNLGVNTSDAVKAAYTLQAMSDDGTHWKRTINWGLGSCGFLEFGSYDLVKVMDGDGKPVQPHYDDFLKYQGEVPLLLWTGWENATFKSQVAQGYADATGTVPR